MCKLWVLPVHDHYDSSNFQVRQISAAKNQHFSVRFTVAWIKVSEKNNIEIFLFEILPQASRQKVAYFATRKIL